MIPTPLLTHLDEIENSTEKSDVAEYKIIDPIMSLEDAGLRMPEFQHFKEFDYGRLFHYNYNCAWNVRQLSFDKKFLDDYSSNIFRYCDTSTSMMSRKNSIIFIAKELWVAFNVDQKNDDSYDYVDVSIYFSHRLVGDVNKIIHKYKRVSSPVPKISFLCSEHGALYYETAEIPLANIDFDNYNKGFKDSYVKIQEWLFESDSKGLAIFHGAPGTGKTTFIRHLASQHVLTYIPPDLAGAISSPEFITFLVRNPHRIFVIEDAENIIIKNGDGRSSALQNLLNSTDGLLADIIKSKFILTFNTELDNIDSALLRPGRARVIYKFDTLDADVCSKLAKKLNVELSSYHNKSLAEVYNKQAEVHLLKPTTRTIGFA